MHKRKETGVSDFKWIKLSFIDDTGDENHEKCFSYPFL